MNNTTRKDKHLTPIRLKSPLTILLLLLLLLLLLWSTHIHHLKNYRLVRWIQATQRGEKEVIDKINVKIKNCCINYCMEHMQNWHTCMLIELNISKIQSRFLADDWQLASFVNKNRDLYNILCLFYKIYLIFFSSSYLICLFLCLVM